MRTHIFKETQKFSPFWIGISFGLFLCLILGLLASVPDFYTQPYRILILIGLSTIVLLFLLSVKFEIRIDDKNLHYRYIPIINHWRIYNFEDIKHIELKKYNSLTEFGGWGIRYNFDYWLYNTGGRYGLLITTKKTKFMLGTHEPEQALKAISQYKTYKLSQNAS